MERNFQHCLALVLKHEGGVYLENRSGQARGLRVGFLAET